MNKNIVIVVILGAVVILGGWWYVSNQQAVKDKAMMEEKAMSEKVAMEKVAMEKAAMMKKEEAMKQPEVMVKKDDAMMEKKAETVMMKGGGQYVPYDLSKLAFAKEGKVVLFFRASWCPSCRALDADIKANLGQIPANVLILDVDYDKSADLKKQYGVTYQHTLVQVNENGTMIAKWSGSPELGDLLKEVK